MTVKLCTTCKYCVSEEYGYSNWTVEGTSLACLRGLNDPLDGTEQPWGNEPISVESAIRFAEQCEAYVEGDGPSRDCDCETTAEDFKDDPDIYPLLKERWA